MEDNQVSTHQLLKKMTAADWREQAVENYMNCVLCGGDLKFSHATDFANLSVHEEAHCPRCQIQAHKDDHRLQ